MTDILPQHDLDERRRIGTAWVTPKSYAELATRLDAEETKAEKLDKQAALNARRQPECPPRGFLVNRKGTGILQGGDGWVGRSVRSREQQVAIKVFDEREMVDVDYADIYIGDDETHHWYYREPEPRHPHSLEARVGR